MEKSLLIRLLASLNADELVRLDKFVQSPYFNNRTEVAVLCRLLIQNTRKGMPLPSKETLFTKVFATKTYDDHRLRVAMSLCYQLVCRFISLEALEQDTTAQQRALAHALRQRNLPERAAKALQQASVNNAVSQFQNAAALERKYQLTLDHYRADVDAYQTERSDLQALSHQLDDAYIARKLWQACFTHSHSTLFNTQFDSGLLQQVLNYLQLHPNKLQRPAIGLYYHCYLALTQPAHVAHFQTFMQVFRANNEVFPDDELRDIFVLAINFCSRQYNAGNQHYLREQFDLYRQGLEHGYFLTEGNLAPYTYTNAATLGLILGELDWVAQFVEEYAAALRPEYRDGLYHFNHARLAYRKRDLGHALQLLQKADYKDQMLQLGIKTLQVKIYYELGEHDVLLSHLQAFRAFLQRRNKMGYHRDNYLHLVQFTSKVLELELSDKKSRHLLREQIAATKAVAEKEWLLGIL